MLVLQTSDPDRESRQPAREPTHEPTREELLAEIARLRELNDSLTCQVEHFQQHLAPPGQDYYTYDALLIAVARARAGGIYGAAIDYAKASELGGCRKVSSNEMQTWQRNNQVPRWAIEQISQMTFLRRRNPASPLWTKAENCFLAALVEAGEHNHKKLAALCSERFGREITESAVKGKLTRLNLHRTRYTQ